MRQFYNNLSLKVFVNTHWQSAVNLASVNKPVVFLFPIKPERNNYYPGWKTVQNQRFPARHKATLNQMARFSIYAEKVNQERVDSHLRRLFATIIPTVFNLRTKSCFVLELREF